MRTIEIKLCEDDKIHVISILLKFGRVWSGNGGLVLSTESCVKTIHDALVNAKLVYPFYLYSKVD